MENSYLERPLEGAIFAIYTVFSEHIL